jgi:choice-of-anchor A domain-containing protein
MLGSAATYAVLYEGTGGHNLQITNVSVRGNVGVGGTANVNDSGPSSIGGVDFSASNAGQFSNNNGSNVVGSVNYNVSAATSALNTVNTLSATLGAETGTSITIDGTQTIDASGGTPDSLGDYVFNVTSYSEQNGNVLTINGNGHAVVFNLNVNGNPQLGGDVILNGLTPDQVLFNYTGTGNISLNNNASSYSLPAAFMGTILAPNAAISLDNANLDGRVFGGASSDMQIFSGTTIDAPVCDPVPEPSSYLLSGLGCGLIGLGLCRRHASRTIPPKRLS